MTNPDVSVVIFTLNEELNLPYCLESLSEFDDVVVVDSFSTDRTLSICKHYGIPVQQREFDGFGSQRNWVLTSLGLKHDWVLFLDADESVTPEFVLEMAKAVDKAAADLSAFMISRKFILWGQWLKRSSLFPTWVVRLVKKGKLSYFNRGHAESQEVDGRIEKLGSPLIDRNIKPIDDWFLRQHYYSSKEALHELSSEMRYVNRSKSGQPPELGFRERLKALARRLPCRWVWYFFYSYLFRGGFLDGVNGFRFCVMRSFYYFQIDIKKVDIKYRETLDDERSDSGG